MGEVHDHYCHACKVTAIPILFSSIANDYPLKTLDTHSPLSKGATMTKYNKGAKFR
jgi:hypothetical protein